MAIDKFLINNVLKLSETNLLTVFESKFILMMFNYYQISMLIEFLLVNVLMNAILFYCSMSVRKHFLASSMKTSGQP